MINNKRDVYVTHKNRYINLPAQFPFQYIIFEATSRIYYAEEREMIKLI